MTKFGFSLMCELHHPNDLVEQAKRAEAAGFDFLTISDHYHPWLYSHGHSPYAWSVLGALAAVTETVELVSLVTCPIIRYHPAIVAQKAATIGAMSGGRFRLGLGAGENLNEHVVGEGWPPADDAPRDAGARRSTIMRELWQGGYVTHHGDFYDVEDARVFTLPDEPVPLDIAVSGDKSIALAAEYGDGVIAVQPEAEFVDKFRERVGQGRRPGDRPGRRVGHGRRRRGAEGRPRPPALHDPRLEGDGRAAEPDQLRGRHRDRAARGRRRERALRQRPGADPRDGQVMDRRGFQSRGADAGAAGPGAVLRAVGEGAASGADAS